MLLFSSFYDFLVFIVGKSDSKSHVPPRVDKLYRDKLHPEVMMAQKYNCPPSRFNGFDSSLLNQVSAFPALALAAVLVLPTARP